MAFDAPVFKMQIPDSLSQQSVHLRSAGWVDGISYGFLPARSSLVFESHSLAFRIQNFIKYSYLIFCNQQASPEQLTFLE